MNSCEKGKRGERELRDELRAAGFCKAIRGKQYSGGDDSPDVKCPELPSIHWEAKRVEAGNPYVWLTQAIRDAGSKMPIVWHRRNHHESICILRTSDLLALLKETDRVESEAGE